MKTVKYDRYSVVQPKMLTAKSSTNQVQNFISLGSVLIDGGKCDTVI